MRSSKPGFMILLYIAIELIVFGLACKILGVLTSVLLVLLSTLVGCGLLRVNGVETMQRAQAKMQQGQSAGAEIIKGFAISFAAILLIIPGLLTSLLGLLLLIPGTRNFLGRLFMMRGFFKPRHMHSAHSANDEMNPDQHRVIDADFERKD